MAQTSKVKVFMRGSSQAVIIPAEYRFMTNEVYIRRDPQNGDLILSEDPGGWEEVFAVLDKAGFPEDFMADRAQGTPQKRDVR